VCIGADHQKGNERGFEGCLVVVEAPLRSPGTKERRNDYMGDTSELVTSGCASLSKGEERIRKSPQKGGGSREDLRSKYLISLRRWATPNKRLNPLKKKGKWGLRTLIDFLRGWRHGNHH